jgi:transposase
MKTTNKLPGMDEVLAGSVEAESLADKAAKQSHEPPRLRRPDRLQVVLEPTCWEERLAADHPVRAVWAVVERLDLSLICDGIAARGERPGRPATDPRLLVALWLYATIENVGSARRLAELCRMHDAYRWLCGGVTLNHHTLSDFRVEQEEALDDLMTQVIAALVAKKLVKVERISQDGMRTRASAGASSFRRQGTLERLLKEARAHVDAVKRQADESLGENARVRAARERAARERVERIESALAIMPQLQAVKGHWTGKPSKDQPARASTTDPQARRMKMAGGAVRPAYNVQFATDVESRAIVGVEVVNTGSDQSQADAMRQQVEHRTGLPVKEQLVDGGFVKKEQIDLAEAAGTAIYAPLPTGKDGQPCVVGRGDSPAVAAWRQRMTEPRSKEIYKQRAATAETVNAETSAYRGLSRFLVRGLNKVRCVAIWSALAYNVVHFARHLSG